MHRMTRISPDGRTGLPSFQKCFNECEVLLRSGLWLWSSYSWNKTEAKAKVEQEDKEWKTRNFWHRQTKEWQHKESISDSISEDTKDKDLESKSCGITSKSQSRKQLKNKLDSKSVGHRIIGLTDNAEKQQWKERKFRILTLRSRDNMALREAHVRKRRVAEVIDRRK